MDIEFLLRRLEQYILEESPKVFGTRLVNEDAIRSQLAQFREALPEEVQNAREIVQQKESLLDATRREAGQIIAKAQGDVERLAGEHQITQEARHQAQVILQRADREAARLRADADEYVFDALSQLQEEMTRILQVVENGLRKLESEREQDLQGREQGEA